MKKNKLILFLALGLFSCAGTNTGDLTGCWIETSSFYVQGMNLSADGTAESVGMKTLLYHKWSLSGDQLILSGESVGNGQTIQFADTMRIIRLSNDTLVVDRKGQNVVFVKEENGIAAVNSQPSRKAYDGFVWKELQGAGLKLFVQENENIRLAADSLLPGIVIVRKGDSYNHKVIQVFDLPNKNINDVIDILSKSDNWDRQQTCKFKEVQSARNGVRRYVMVPDGDYEAQINLQMKSEPVPFTCNGWGVGNSGMRYFEVHDNHPDKAVFVEIGQDAPLFDENSIVFDD